MSGLAIGSCVTVGGFAICSISGGSLNPAVSIGIASQHVYGMCCVDVHVFQSIYAMCMCNGFLYQTALSMGMSKYSLRQCFVASRMDFYHKIY